MVFFGGKAASACLSLMLVCLCFSSTAEAKGTFMPAGPFGPVGGPVGDTSPVGPYTTDFICDGSLIDEVDRFIMLDMVPKMNSPDIIVNQLFNNTYTTLATLLADQQSLCAQIIGTFQGGDQYLALTPSHYEVNLQLNSTVAYYKKFITYFYTRNADKQIARYCRIMRNFTENLMAMELGYAKNAYLMTWNSTIKPQILSIIDNKIKTNQFINSLTGLPLEDPPNANVLAPFGLGSVLVVQMAQMLQAPNPDMQTIGYLLYLFRSLPIIVSDIDDRMIEIMAITQGPKIFGFIDDQIKAQIDLGYCADFWINLKNRLYSPNADVFFRTQAAIYTNFAPVIDGILEAGGGVNPATVGQICDKWFAYQPVALRGVLDLTRPYGYALKA